MGCVVFFLGRGGAVAILLQRQIHFYTLKKKAVSLLPALVHKKLEGIVATVASTPLPLGARRPHTPARMVFAPLLPVAGPTSRRAPPTRLARTAAVWMVCVLPVAPASKFLRFRRSVFFYPHKVANYFFLFSGQRVPPFYCFPIPLFEVLDRLVWPR